MGIAAVSFKDKNGIEFVIYPRGGWDDINFDAATLEEGIDMTAYEGKKTASKAELSKLDIATSVDGQKILRLRETVTYTCRVRMPGKMVRIRFAKALFSQMRRTINFSKRQETKMHYILDS